MSQLHLPPTASPTTLTATPTVFLIDDDAIRRKWLGLLVLRTGWAVGCFECAEDFLALSPLVAPACLVVNFELADVSGQEMQRRLADRPDLPIIFLYGGTDVRSAVCAMKAGAFELLTEPLSDATLLGAISHAIEHSRAALARRVALDMLRVRYASLSMREREVMSLVVRGRLNKQIGAELGISEITVKAHRGSMMRKMAVRTVPDIVNMAARLFPVAESGWSSFGKASTATRPSLIERSDRQSSRASDTSEGLSHTASVFSRRLSGDSPQVSSCGRPPPVKGKAGQPSAG